MLAIPPDPHKVLSTRLKLEELKDYEETWTASSDSVQLLKNVISIRAKPITHRVFEGDMSCRHISNWHITTDLN
jgi:hypothetical protein